MEKSYEVEITDWANSMEQTYIRSCKGLKVSDLPDVTLKI